MVESSPRVAAPVTESLATAASGGGCLLKVVEGPDRGATRDLESGAAVIGVDEDSDLRLTDAAVSRKHCRIDVTASGLVVTDLKSSNGTYYLETRIDRATLVHGATLRLGRTRVTLASRAPTGGADYSERTSYGAIVGASPAMRRLIAVLERIEKYSDYTVLVCGESGVGKEVVAREIHRASARARAPFEVCDCTALPRSLAEGELFGHVRGAFTGAEANRAGVFERADGGTLFLDEVGELPLELQPKLLRVLQSREVKRLGAQESRKVNIRVIAATNRDLAAEVRAGRFREDLYFRLKMVTVEVPPLRERREDIPALVDVLLSELGADAVGTSSATMELFTTGYNWPGNVRELRHAIASTVALGVVPDAIGGGPVPVAGTPAEAAEPDASFQEAKRRAVDAFERDYLAERLRRAQQNISRAAREAGVERSYFRQLLNKHGLLARANDK